MKKLFIGANFDQVKDKSICCDFCRENDKPCVMLERKVYYTQYDTEYQSEFFGGLKEVVTGENMEEQIVRVHVCADCAKQIYQSLK